MIVSVTCEDYLRILTDEGARGCFRRGMVIDGHFWDRDFKPYEDAPISACLCGYVPVSK